MSTEKGLAAGQTRFLFEQMAAMTVANIKARYRKTFAGFLWVVMGPLVTFAVQLQIFSRVLHVETHNYAVFLVSGLLPWIFLTQTLEMATPLLVSSGTLLKAFPIHPVVLLGAQLLDCLFNFLVATAILVTVVSFYEPISPQGFIFLPAAIVTVAVAALGMAWFLSVLQVFFRDTKFILSFALNLLFFLTPVFYPVDLLPEPYRDWVAFNPLYRLITPFRVAIYSFDSSAMFHELAGALAVAAISMCLGIWMWKRKKNELYFRI